MESGAQRLVMAAALLAGLWVVVYWITPAPDGDTQTPPITFDQPPAAPADEPPGLESDGSDDEPTSQESRPAQGPPPVEAPGQEPVVMAPTFTSYTWRRGDDLAALAERFYGDPDLAMVISKANSMTDMLRIRPGTVIRIPDDPENIQGLDVDPVTGLLIPPEEDVIEQGLVTEYVVERNDTLTGIAKALYGRASMWKIIRDANLHQIKRMDGSDIRPGMRLVIPPPPDVSAAGSRSQRNGG